jgi:tetratricopeptide (TPR) repeat protein
VAKNKVTAEALGRGGELGDAAFVARVTPLLAMKPAYDKHDKAVQAARKKEYAQARQLATEAATALPKEARFQQTLGEIALAEKDEKKAIGHYEKAIQLDPDYFGSYLGAGVAQFRSGNKAKAEELFTASTKLLPTAPAAYYLGELAKGRGETQKAMQYYQAAASAQGEVGQAAAGEFVRLDLPQNPGNYVAAAGQADANGRVIVVVQNRAPVALSDIRVTPVLVNAGGQVVSTGATVRLTQALAPNERVALDSGLGQLSSEQLQGLRFRVEGARVGE